MNRNRLLSTLEQRAQGSGLNDKKLQFEVVDFDDVIDSLVNS